MSRVDFPRAVPPAVPGGGSLRVYDEPRYATVQEDAMIGSMTRSRPIRKRDKTATSAHPSPRRAAFLENLRRQRAAAEEKLMAKTLQMEKETKRKVEQTKQEEEQQLHELLQQIDGERATLVHRLATFLDHHDNAERRKKMQLYEEWNQQVFQNIQNQVGTKLSEEYTNRRTAERRELYAEFLDATNRKGSIFRDIIIESDYDPLQLRDQGIRYRMSASKDPVKRDLLKATGEHAIMGMNQTRSSPLKARVRPVLAPTVWDKIEATPYYDRLEKSSVSSSHSNLLASHVRLDHFQVARGNEIADKEFRNMYGRGKRVQKPASG